MAVKDGKACKIHQSGDLTIRQKNLKHSPNCSQNTPAGWEITMAVKDGQAFKIRQTAGLTSLLDPTDKLCRMRKHHGSKGRKVTQEPSDSGVGSGRKVLNHSPNCSQNTPARWENTMAVKCGKACKIHQTGGCCSSSSTRRSSSSRSSSSSIAV